MVIPLPMGVVDEVEDHNHTMCYQDFLLEAGASLRIRGYSHLHSIGKIFQSGSNLTAMCGSPFAEPVVRSIPSTRNSDNNVLKDRLALGIRIHCKALSYHRIPLPPEIQT